MAHIALYREWRPQRFSDMVGQEHLTRTLQNALQSGRLAHAYLFNGPRGTGKTSAAKILARAINCLQGPSIEPCNECQVCKGILDGSNLDVREIDAASNRGVDEIRDIRDKIKMVPTEARTKVYIIDEVHMLTTEAFNALLKTLEEPPSHVLFILATTEPHKLPATVVSRCQRFDFRRILTRDIVGRLKRIASEKVAQVEEEAYWIVARSAEGGMRDALSLFDQVLSLGSMQVTVKDVEELIGTTSLKRLGELAQAIAKRDQTQALLSLSQLLDIGKDPGQFLHEWTGYFRDLMLFKTVPDLTDMQDRLQYDEDFAQVAAEFTVGRLAEILDQCGHAQTELKWQNQARLLVELLIVRLCRVQDPSAEGLLERLAAVEQELAQLRGSMHIQNAPERSALLQKTAPERTAAQVNQTQSGFDGSRVPTDRASAEAAPSLSGTAAFASGADPSRDRSKSSEVRHSSGAETQGQAAHAGGLASAPLSGDAVLAKFRDWQQPDLQGRLAAASSQWSRILDRVKQLKIQTQAWLMNGEPVAVASGAILVAFKNQIHMETCLKDMHREIIETVFQELLQENYRFMAVLSVKWEAYRSSSQAEPAAVESIGSEPDAGSQEKDVDRLIQDVTQVFGSDVVEIVE